MQGGSLIGMDLGTKEAGAKRHNLKMLYHVANIGDYKFSNTPSNNNT